MQFESFHWLCHYGIWAIIPWSTKMASVCVIFGPFCFYCSLVFYILGAFLIKELFHSRLLDMRWLSPTRRYAPRWVSITSYPTHAHGIIVNYYISKLVRALWLVNLAGRTPPHGPLKFKVVCVAKLLRDLLPQFLNYLASKGVKLSFTLNCMLERSNDLKTISNWLILLSTCFRNLKPFSRG